MEKNSCIRNLCNIPKSWKKIHVFEIYVIFQNHGKSYGSVKLDKRA